MFSLPAGRHGFLAYSFMGTSSYTYSLVEYPQGLDNLEDSGAAEELRCQHGHFPQEPVLGAAVGGQGPGAVLVSQQLQQRLGGLLSWRHGLLQPCWLCLGAPADIEAGFVLQTGREERQWQPRAMSHGCTPPSAPDPYPAAEAAGEVLQPQVPQVLLKSSRDAAECCHPAPAWQGIPWLSGFRPCR